MNTQAKLLHAILFTSVCYSGLAMSMDFPPAIDRSGALFTQTNAPDENKVLMYKRDDMGQLEYVMSVSTAGKGTGNGLGNQGSLAISRHHQWLFVVNAGSNEISSFKITKKGLKLVNIVNSGGMRPVSVAVFDHLLYVLNADSDSIAGYMFDNQGQLTPLENSTRKLSGVGTAPAEISFNPWGDLLVVTEKATNRIDTWQVRSNGLTSKTIVNASAGTTPFGFKFNRRGELVVSEAAAGALDASSTSSYRVLNDGSLQIASAAVPTTETAACWVMTSPNGRYAYVANAGSASISGYDIHPDGQISLLNADGVTASTGAGTHPTDMAISKDGHYLYVNTPSTMEIHGFRVAADGSLASIQDLNNLPAGFNGLAAY